MEFDGKCQRRSGKQLKKSAKTFCHSPVQEVSLPAEECPWKADGCSGLVPAKYPAMVDRSCVES